MSESCSNIQNALYTASILTPSEYAHVATCSKCQAVQNALHTIDGTYLIKEAPAAPRFAQVLVSQIKEKYLVRRKTIKGTAVAVCAALLIFVMQGWLVDHTQTLTSSKRSVSELEAVSDYGQVQNNFYEADKKLDQAALAGSPAAQELGSLKLQRSGEKGAVAEVLKNSSQFGISKSKSFAPVTSADAVASTLEVPLSARDDVLAKEVRPSRVKKNETSSLSESDQVTYIDPNGYWENTYLPGSPAIPLLVELLHNTTFSHIPIDPVLNASGVFLIQHRTDPPLQGALGLTGHTNLAYIDKPQRVLLQVTIKGAERAKGNRPPLTIVVVVPYSNNISIQEHQVIQDSLRALETERRVDDHIAVLTDQTDEFISFADFRYGTLELFLKNFQQGPNPTSNILPETVQALYSKASTLALRDENSQLRERIILTIGHSGVGSLEPTYPSIDNHVLQGGTGSVLALNDNIELMRLSARGQGSYRVLQPSVPAVQEVRAELESYGAVVARALRLNVQLQPGVELKEIIGSTKLTSPEIELEKAIEVATDKRIAQSLGIQTDRGDDDPGIQILIPRFLNGDSHIIILDLFVERAGPIADISLKSKDLVLMRNESIYASAALPAYTQESGVINAMVENNEYAQRLATVIRMVRSYSEEGNLEQGITVLQNFILQLEHNAPASNEKINTTNLINNYISFLKEMIISSRQEDLRSVRETVTGALDVTSGKILGNATRSNK